MKQIIYFICIIPVFGVKAQQGASLQFISPGSEKNIALYGIGNLNTEALTNINAAGKFSGALRLDNKSDTRKWTFFLSVNRNASNGDSTLATTLLFPEVGKAAFIGTLNSMWKLYPNRAGQTAYIGGFCQGTFKSINGKRNIKTTGRDTTALFTMLDWEIGIRYLRNVFDDISTNTHCLFSASLFLNYYNIPDEDNDDYRLIFNEPRMPSDFLGLGVRLAVEINRAQVFGDFRHVFGSSEKIPNRDLRGVNLNVGVIFNADIIER